MTYDFTYTKHFGVNSSWVDDVYYNANERYVVIDLDNEMYRYDNVSLQDVEKLANASSVGAYYNTTFKHAFGPGTYLGHWDNVDYDVVDEVKGGVINTGGSTISGTLVAKDFDSTPVTKEFSLAGPVLAEGELDAVKTGGVAPSTKEYSLQTPVVEEFTDYEDGAFVDTVSTVYFTLDGFDKVYEYASDKEEVDSAIAEVNDYVSRVGGRGKVVKVVFEFE